MEPVPQSRRGSSRRSRRVVIVRAGGRAVVGGGRGGGGRGGGRGGLTRELGGGLLAGHKLVMVKPDERLREAQKAETVERVAGVSGGPWTRR